MKNKIHLTLILALCTLAFAAQAQLPNFTKVDTGAITQLWGGHIKSSCFDMDNDGDLDINSSNNGVYVTTDRIFSRFKNERNGFYVKMPQFIDSTDYLNVRSFGDIDNDGDMDLFRGSMNGNELKLYTNDGYGSFLFNTSFYLTYPNSYATLLDLNNDGYLDILGIDRYGCVRYNNGNGEFPGTTGLGIFQPQPNVFLHGVSWGDPDDDGDFDFYGGYTTMQGGIPINVCYLNNGNGTFTQFDPTSVIVEGTCATPCVNWVDYDNDGDMDLYVLNSGCDGSLPALYENLGNMEFTKHDIIDEIYRYSFANSSVWGDLDNDADLDLFISVENNVFPWGGGTSATPYNIIYLNDGNGQFTDYLEEHPLTLEDTHTAMLFDQDNDGDLDVLMSRYSWSNDGYNNLFVNEGNDNSWIVLTCEGTASNRTAIGARIQAKCFVNGKHITQTREITPINGHLSYANLRVHFGLGDAEVIDTLLIRWPSGIVDTYLGVEANHFYRAVEDEELKIDFKATNYIEYSPPIADIGILEDETISIDLKDHYHFITGDTVPVISGDTLTFELYGNENPEAIAADLNGSILTLTGLASGGESNIQVTASAGFTERMDEFNVMLPDGVFDNSIMNFVLVHPNPFSNAITIEYHLKQPEFVTLTIYNHLGKQVEVIEKKQSQGKQQVVWNSEGLPAGIYFCILKTNEGLQTRKLIKL